MADFAIATGGASASLTYSADANGGHHSFEGVYWSFATAPTGGAGLTITDGGTTVFALDLTSAGVGSVLWPYAKRTAATGSLAITVSPGGNSNTTKINVINHSLNK